MSLKVFCNVDEVQALCTEQLVSDMQMKFELFYLFYYSDDTCLSLLFWC